MAIGLFIDETYLKDNSPLSGNVDIQELYPFVKTAEDIYIQEAIGTTLYNDLKTKINANDTLSAYPNELTLVKKIRDAVLWYTCYDALPFIAIKIRNIGVVNQSGDSLSNADRANTSYLRQELKDKGDFYLKRVQDYLCEYESLFPAYDIGTKDELNPNFNAPSPNCDIAFDKNNDSIDTNFYRKYIRGG